MVMQQTIIDQHIYLFVIEFFALKIVVSCVPKISELTGGAIFLY